MTQIAGEQIHVLAWFMYWLGAMLTLLSRYGNEVWLKTKPPGRKVATIRFLLEHNWVLTIGVVWVFGGLVVTNHQLFLPEYLHDSAPLPAVAFTVGAVIELVAPPLAKKIRSLVGSFVDSSQ